MNPMTTQELLQEAQSVKYFLGELSGSTKSAVLKTMADCLNEHSEDILAANALDVEAARDTISPVMIDRLQLTQARIEDMAKGIRDVAALADPCGKILGSRSLPSGLLLKKMAVPLGVIAIIYESRPNVTSDAASLAFKSGNVCVLRGGKESYRSNRAIVDALHDALRRHKMPETLICLIQDTTRQSAKELMHAVGLVDLLIPRGGSSLIQTCVQEAQVPCIHTGTGICHIYVDEHARLDKALRILENAKLSRPSVCNAMEVCLVHETVAPTILPMLHDLLVSRRKMGGLTPVELRLDARAAEIIQGTPADDSDYDTEFLDYILTIKVVSDLREAINHINAHSTGHSEAILTEKPENATYFSRMVDSAVVYINASTRFTDGGQFGLGCEMGISTQKLHARGPMGLDELTAYKYVVRGDGQIR